MKNKLNNKGYLLVEIVLASVLAMVIAYFMTDLTIKLKNKNDDLLVKTLVSTDQAIIYNTIMTDLYQTSDDINCDYIINKMTIDGNDFTYNGFTNIVSKYASISNYECDNTGINGINAIEIKIPIEVEQLPDEKFDVNIKFKK